MFLIPCLAVEITAGIPAATDLGADLFGEFLSNGVVAVTPLPMRIGLGKSTSDM
jgi:hypothetical protein